MTTREVRSVGSIADRENGNAVGVAVDCEDDARCLSTDLAEICRPEGLGDIASLGLTLPEAKQLLASVQRAVGSAQADSHGLRRPCCSACNRKCHLKDWRGHHIATLFGAVTVPLPRFRCTACNRIATSVGWPSRCRATPELDQLRAHLSALMTYRVASGVLQHLLPMDAGLSPETLRNHTLRIGAQIGSATSDQPTTAAAVITVSVDSTFIRSREEGANVTWKCASAMSKQRAKVGRCSERWRRPTPTSRR
jgi:hypothetical protein